MIVYFESIIGDRSSIYYIFGHTIDIFKKHVVNLPTWAQYSTLKMINIGLLFVGSQWLNSIMSSLTSERDHWSLRAQLSGLFEPEFI